MTIRARFLFVCLPLAAAVACGGGKETPPAAGSSDGHALPPPSAAARAEARQTFDTICAACHGTTGRGDGPAAAAMEPKPRSFGDKAWQGSISDDHVLKVITLGGAAVGKSPVMPAQPQLKGKPEMLRALVEIVRGYAK